MCCLSFRPVQEGAEADDPRVLSVMRRLLAVLDAAQSTLVGTKSASRGVGPGEVPQWGKEMADADVSSEAEEGEEEGPAAAGWGPRAGTESAVLNELERLSLSERRLELQPQPPSGSAISEVGEARALWLMAASCCVAAQLFWTCRRAFGLGGGARSLGCQVGCQLWRICFERRAALWLARRLAKSRRTWTRWS